MRLLGPALAAVVLLAGCAQPDQDETGPPPPASSPTASAPTASTPTAPCPESGLLVTAERGEAAAGYREMSLIVRNCGDKTYTLQGRPDIVVLDDHQNPLPVQVVPSTHFTASPRRITIEPGRGAMATLSWHSTVEAGKDVATGAFLAVAPLAGVTHQTVPLPAPLDLGPTGKLESSAWL